MQVPVAEGVFTWPTDEPQLIGSRCTACGIVTFPTQDSCPRCASTEMAEQLLRGAGRLWAWTTQDFPPPSPPYAGPTGDGLRAVRRRLRRAARRGEGRGAPHRVRSRRARARAWRWSWCSCRSAPTTTATRS